MQKKKCKSLIKRRTVTKQKKATALLMFYKKSREFHSTTLIHLQSTTTIISCKTTLLRGQLTLCPVTDTSPLAPLSAPL